MLFGIPDWFWRLQIRWFLQVQDAVKCRVVDRQEEGNGDSGGSFQNGHAQLMVGKTTTYAIVKGPTGFFNS